jgi:hypothetical protein
MSNIGPFVTGMANSVVKHCGSFIIHPMKASFVGIRADRVLEFLTSVYMMSAATAVPRLSDFLTLLFI